MKKKDAQDPAPSEQVQAYHIPVMLSEVIDHLKISENGTYVDCTFGGGGHSKAILQRLGPAGKLIAFDQDADAKKNLPDDDRILFVQHNFRHLQRFLKLNGIHQVDGILADLGISSHQIDEPARGFSTRYEAALDMRMDQRQSLTAVQVINEYSELQLHKLFEQYGEVTNSKTLARHLIETRKSKKIKTIDELKAALAIVVKGNPKKYFAQVFQALRIEVNDEMGALKELLIQVPQVLNKGGRAVFITFHSLEDRLVKIFFRDNSFDAPEESPFETAIRNSVLKPVNKKPITASAEEQKRNSRSRSAKLRVAEKT